MPLPKTATSLVLQPFFVNLLFVVTLQLLSSADGTFTQEKGNQTQLGQFPSTTKAASTPLATSRCYEIHPAVVNISESPLQLIESQNLESCKQYCWFLPGCDSFIYNSLHASCWVYGGPANTSMLLLKHEVYAEKSCFMHFGEMSESCEDVQKIVNFSKEEGALALNLLTNTCIGVLTRKDTVELNFVGCHEAPLWTLEITSIEPRLMRLKMKGTEKCIELKMQINWSIKGVVTIYRGYIASCLYEYKQEFLLQQNTTKILGLDTGRYCHRPISSAGGLQVFLSHEAVENLDISRSLDAITFVRKSQMVFPCYWYGIGNGELVWTVPSGTFKGSKAGTISTTPPFVLPGGQALVRCEEGFGLELGGEWNREFRVTCTGNITQPAPRCEKMKIDLMVYLTIGQAALILILSSVIICLIYRVIVKRDIAKLEADELQKKIPE